MGEVVLLDRARLDRHGIAKALAIARAQDVVAQRNAAAVRLDLVDRRRDIGVRLIERDPCGQLEEAGDVGVGGERRRVIDEHLARRIEQAALVGEAVRHVDRFPLGGRRVERIVDVAVGLGAAGLALVEAARCEHVVRAAADRIEIPGLGARGHRIERRRVAPGLFADDIERDLVLEELGLRARLHRPVVPRRVQRIHVEQRRLAELEAGDFSLRRARARMIPRPDDEVVPRLARFRRVLHVRAIERHRAGLVAVVMAGDRKDRQIELGVLLRRRAVAVPVRVLRRMLDPGVEDRRRIADPLVQLGERRVRLVPAPELRAPEIAVAEDLFLCGLAADEGQPLHVVRIEDIVAHRVVDAGHRRCDRHDRGQVRRKLLRGRPLVIARVRTAPHRDLAVAVRLRAEPFDDIVAVLRFLQERRELAFGIAAAAHVDGREHVTVRGEVHATVVVALRDVRRQREHARQRLFLIERPVQRRVELDAIAQRHLDAPLELHGIAGWLAVVGSRCERASQREKTSEYESTHVFPLDQKSGKA